VGVGHLPRLRFTCFTSTKARILTQKLCACSEWASVISLAFSDESEHEFVVNATEEHGR
jgi:hypothetical protein